jgi:uncharacterized membrane protein YhaH (DUF805 family)
MSPIKAVKKGLSNIANFKGRSSRSEFWWLFLFVMIFGIGIQWILMSVSGASALQGSFEIAASNPLTLIYMGIFEFSLLLFCVLMLACVARRFQDHGWSGGWFRLMMGSCAAALAVGLYSLIVDLTSGDPLFANHPSWVFSLLMAPYVSIISTFWIGFVRPEAGPNT